MICHIRLLSYWSKIAKVPRGIQDEQSRKDMASSGKLVPTKRNISKSQKEGRNQACHTIYLDIQLSWAYIHVIKQKTYMQVGQNSSSVLYIIAK